MNASNRKNTHTHTFENICLRFEPFMKILVRIFRIFEQKSEQIEHFFFYIYICILCWISFICHQLENTSYKQFERQSLTVKINHKQFFFIHTTVSFLFLSFLLVFSISSHWHKYLHLFEMKNNLFIVYSNAMNYG